MEKDTALESTDGHHIPEYAPVFEAEDRAGRLHELEAAFEEAEKAIGEAVQALASEQGLTDLLPTVGLVEPVSDGAGPPDVREVSTKTSRQDVKARLRLLKRLAHEAEHAGERMFPDKLALVLQTAKALFEVSMAYTIAQLPESEPAEGTPGSDPLEAEAL